MHSKNNNIEIMISDETGRVIKILFDLLKKDIEIIWNQWKVASLSLITSIYIINVIRQICFVDKKQKSNNKSHHQKR